MNRFYKCEHCDKILSDKKGFKFHVNTCFLDPGIHTKQIEESEPEGKQNGRFLQVQDNSERPKDQLKWWRTWMEEDDWSGWREK